MSKKQPIKVTIKETRHKKQPWTVTIDMPGNNPLDELRERYARVFTAKRGAIRKLKAQQSPVTKEWFVTSRPNGDVRWIELVIVKLKKK
jgi:hypothetical protein